MVCSSSNTVCALFAVATERHTLALQHALGTPACCIQQQPASFGHGFSIHEHLVQPNRHCLFCCFTHTAGSSTQVGVLVVPFCVVLAWMMGRPLDLNFNEFEALVLFVSVLLAAMMVQVGGLEDVIDAPVAAESAVHCKPVALHLLAAAAAH